jgi:peptidoglycan/xylan/chitin deacetylase (PgdA/CDA1 family)
MGWKDFARRGMVAAGRCLADESCGRRVILCYHSIHSTNSFRSASPSLFAEHLQWLGKHCAVVPLRQLVAEKDSPLPGGRTQVAVTFDDGFRDNYEQAFPLLRQYHCAATFFATVGFLEGATGTRVQLFARPEELVPLTWEQAREMAAAGMELGVHSYTHLNLAGIGTEGLKREVVEAKRVMEDRLEQPVVSFAYPYGKKRHYDARVIAFIREAGYHYAVGVSFRGVRPGDSPWTLPRFFVVSDTVEQLESKIRGDWDLIGRAQDAVPVWLSRLVSPRDY